MSEPSPPTPSAAGDRSIRRRWWRWAFVVLAFVVAGVAVLIGAGDSRTTQAVGWGIAGVGMVLAISGLFYEIGASEDRDRANGR